MSSGDGSVTLSWGGEDRRFRLALGQLRELSELINRIRCNIGAQPIGPRAFYHLLESGDAWPHEVREVIRLGLIGGGTAIAEIPSLMRRYFDGRPFPESSLIAPAIFAAAWAGPPEDEVGKKKPEDQTTTAPLPGQPSTGPDASSDSALATSIN